MRTIKFRAWDKERNSMITSKHWFVGFDGVVRPQGREEYDYKNFELMQFTGLLDKNGKEIYEGDIIGYWSKESWTVGFIDGQYVFLYPDDRKAFICSKSSVAKKEIIGNIMENPELLSNPPTSL